MVIHRAREGKDMKTTTEMGWKKGVARKGEQCLNCKYPFGDGDQLYIDEGITALACTAGCVRDLYTPLFTDA